MSDRFVKAKVFSDIFGLGDAAMNRLLDRLAKEGRIRPIQPNSRVRRFPFDATLAAIMASSTSAGTVSPAPAQREDVA